MARKYKGVLPIREALRRDPRDLIIARKAGWLPPLGGGALESNIIGLWVSRQTAKGTPADMTTGVKSMRWVGGDIQTNRADGTEAYSDGTLFGDTVDFVNTLIGNGAPVVQGQPGVVAYLSYLASGQEAVTGGTNDVQTIPAGTATGGTFTISMNGYTTAPLSWNATNTDISTALLAATNSAGQTLPAGSVAVTGGPVNTTPVVVTFQGALGNQPVPLMTLDTTLLTGGTIGAVTHTTPGTGYQHVATPNDLGGFYSTWTKSVGKTVIHRNQFNDCRIQSLRLEGSSASKVLKATPTFISLDPGQIPAANPTKTDDGTRPFIYTEAMGTFTIDGQVYRGHSAFALECQWGLQEWYGDDVVPFDVINTRATVLLQGITIILDAQGLTRYNNQIYGVSNPPTNAKPLHSLPLNGGYSCQFNKVSQYTGLTSDSLKVEVPSVKWDPNLNIPANPAGGPVELAMAAEYRKAAGQPAYRITTVSSTDAAYT